MRHAYSPQKQSWIVLDTLGEKKSMKVQLVPFKVFLGLHILATYFSKWRVS
jgi:hypothetical protein